MASYHELYDLANNSNLIRKVTAAVAIQADVIRQEATNTANHANRMVWAKRAYVQPDAVARELIWAVLAANNTATKAQIEGASDASILTNIATFVDLFATS